MRTACIGSQGVSTRRPPRTRHPPGPGTPQDQTAPQGTRPLDQAHPPVNRMTDRCKHITLPQTSFADGNYHSCSPLLILNES